MKSKKEDFVQKHYSVLKHIPNIISVVRTIASLAIAGIIITTGITNPLVMALTIAAVGATDKLDGMLARKFKCQSETGQRLDALSDKVYHWGIGLSLMATGVLSPLILVFGARDIGAGIFYTRSKYKDGKNKTQEEKKTKTTLKEKLSNFLKVYKNGTPPEATIPAKGRTVFQAAMTATAVLTGGMTLIPWLMAGATAACVAADIKTLHTMQKTHREMKEQPVPIKTNNTIINNLRVDNKNVKYMKFGSSVLRREKNIFRVFAHKADRSIREYDYQLFNIDPLLPEKEKEKVYSKIRQ